jgi:hypothetical protein
MPRRERYRQYSLLAAVARGLVRLVAVAVVAGLLVAAWPLALAGLFAYVAAWASGWPPRRLVMAAVWCLPMVATFAVAYAVAGDGSWQAAAWSPVLAWLRAWRAADAGDWLRAMVVMAPTAIPLGLLTGAAAWRVRIGMIASGAAGWSPGAAVAFDERLWRRSVRTASLRVRAPGGVPVLSRRGNPVLGAVIRSVGSRPRPVLENSCLPRGADMLRGRSSPRMAVMLCFSHSLSRCSRVSNAVSGRRVRGPTS